MSGTGFASFARRAEAGEDLTIAFLGGSLTWGARASDPQTTSYRALVSARFQRTYPQANFRFVDAAIGGTGSQLAIFRMDRDVLPYEPDLVFLDFTINDNIYTLDPVSMASYESVVRRLLAQSVLILQVILTNCDLVKSGEESERRLSHIHLAEFYNLPIADLFDILREKQKNRAIDADSLWPHAPDGTHPGDLGYAAYADGVWDAYVSAVDQAVVPLLPVKRLYARTFDTFTRIQLADLPLPSGWKVGTPNSTSHVGDFVMSRWLDSVVIASAAAAELVIPFRGSFAMLFGELTRQSGRYVVTIDGGEPIERDAFWKEGNGPHHFIFANDLDPGQSHVATIRPLLESGQELRLESLCVAGDPAS